MANFFEKAEVNGTTKLVKATAAKPTQKRTHRKAKADARSSLMSGQKQLETADGPGNSSQRQEYKEYGIMLSEDEDYDEVDEEEEERQRLQTILDKQGNDDDDWDEDRYADDNDDHEINEDGGGGGMTLRSRRGATTAAVSGDSAPVSKTSKKRARSP